MSGKPKLFLVVTASVEAFAGVALLCLPSVAFDLLLGLKTSAVDAVFVGRIAGAALFAMGVASWLAAADEINPSLLGLLAGILIYNVVVTILLVYAGAVLAMAGVMLWPTIVLHASLAAWGGLLLRDGPRRPARSPPLKGAR
jgi:hypothetical protein